MVTGDEDGAVRFYDLRSTSVSGASTPLLTIAPQPAPPGDRASLTSGSWVSSAQVNPNEDWLLCGGGRGVSLWHLGSNTKTTSFATSSSYNATNADFTDVGVCAVGNDGTYRTWAMNGDVQQCVQITPDVAFSAARCPTDDPAMRGVTSVAGNGPVIDIIASAGHMASVSLAL
jgi:WD40 repeat protein